MESKLAKAIAFLLFLITFHCVNGQDIKLIEYKELFKKHKIKQCEVLQVQHKKDGKDSVVIGRYAMNELGMVMHYDEYTTTGQLSCSHFFTYDSKNKLTASAIEFASKPAERFPFQLEFNQAGQLVSRSLSDCGINYWHKESYEYNATKVLTRSIQHYQNESQQVKIEQTYPGEVSPKENTLNFIYDNRGLLILRQFYNSQNKVFKSLVFNYK
jgi:hypothetical protein